MSTLLEHQGKQLLARAGFRLPASFLVREGETMDRALDEVPGPPWFVKAQVPAKGRARAGGIRRVTTRYDAKQAAGELLGRTVRGKLCRSVLVEEGLDGHEEWYLSVLVDPWGRGLTFACSPNGGTDVEEQAPQGRWVATFPLGRLPDADRLQRTWQQVGVGAAPDDLVAAAASLGLLVRENDLVLAELNPLGRDPSGVVVLDAHVTADDAAAYRQDFVAEFEKELAQQEPGVAWRQRWGGDFRVLDAGGEVAMVNTGAGAGMLLIDELDRRNVSLWNFSDIRAGTPNCRSERFAAVTEEIAAADSVQVVLINFHAGITDLTEIRADIQAMVDCMQAAEVPVVLRLEGRGAGVVNASFSESRSVLIRPSLLHAIDSIVLLLEADR